MAYHCRRVREWVEETIEQPIEDWVEQQEERCRTEECNWWLLCTNVLVCWLVTVLVRVVTFVLVTVPKLVVTTVCTVVSVPLIWASRRARHGLCLLGIRPVRRVDPDRDLACRLARICERAYEDSFLPPAGADFEGMVPVPGGMIEVTQGFLGFPIDTQVHVLRDLKAPGRLVVAFRGSESATDWFDNFVFPFVPEPNVAYGWVHLGFSLAYGGVQLPMLRRVILNLGGEPPVSEILFTGHSLGGAMATLAAFDCALRFRRRRRIACWTYGSPRVGNEFFVADFEAAVDESYRFENHDDPVPELPPTGLGYRHVDSLVHLMPDVPWQVEPCPPPAEDALSTLVESVPGLEGDPLAIALSAADTGLAVLTAIPNGFRGHFLSTYRANLGCLDPA